VLARRGAHGSVDPGPRLDYPVRLSDEGVLPDGLGIRRNGLNGCKIVDTDTECTRVNNRSCF